MYSTNKCLYFQLFFCAYRAVDGNGCPENTPKDVSDEIELKLTWKFKGGALYNILYNYSQGV